MADWVELGYISETSTIGATIQSTIHYNYSIGMDPVYLELKQGRFSQVTQASVATTASSSSTYPTASYSPYQVNYSANVSVASSSRPPPLRDEDYVQVTLSRSGGEIASNVYRFRTAAGPVEKRGDEFYEGTHPDGNPCMVYFGVNSGRYYWTWTLDPQHLEHHEHHEHSRHRRARR